jgi:hypothetical protein
MINFLQNISLTLDEVINLITKFVTISAAVSTIVPESSLIGQVIHKAAFNFGKAANKNG